MTSRKRTPSGLPGGTVTLFFADVEGSTRLLAVLGDRYRDVRARSRELVREAAAGHDGLEVDWAGDGAFLVFERPGDALAAAIELQRALAAEPWKPEEALRIRIGVHTGTPELDDEGYVGIDVVIAARICAAAHGGQIVLSRPTKELAETGSLAGASFVPLGAHRLKDISAQVPLYQLVAEGLPETFPPLSTLGGATLPTLHHRLVGRAAQVAEIGELLARRDVRLVTITGPGGSGKSRLALEVATELATQRPVHLVGLAPIADPELVPAAVARVLGVKESPGRPLVSAIADALAGTDTLVYLDNLEHLPAAAVHVRDLLDAVPDLDVLVTSRSPLRLSSERVLQLDPLPVDEAVELFVELAAARGIRLADDALPAVPEICKRLDCLPLAIELVVARLALLAPARLLEALDTGLALQLEGPLDLPDRQRTLRATLDWSYRLLTETQRSLHGALAAFVGGCTLADARAVAEPSDSFLSDLEMLVLGSLVRGHASGGEVRLSMLETVREDALDRLASAGRLDELRRRHAEHFLGLALAAERGLEGPEQPVWAERLERELDNLRVALDWLLASGRGADALRATSALERFWRANAHLTEARRRLLLGLELAADLTPAERALAVRSAAHMAMGQSDWAGAEPLLEEAIRLFDECGDASGEVVALGYLSFVALRQGDNSRARELGDRALAVATELGDERATVVALMALGDVAWVDGSHARAIAVYTDAVELSRRVGDPLLVVSAVYNLGMAAFQGRDLVRARAAFKEALALGLELREAPHTAAAHFMLAELDMLAGDAEAAGEHARESLALYTDLEDDRSRARCLVVLAGVAYSGGDLDDAARLLGAADQLRGVDPPDEFERPVLDRLIPGLESELGEAAVVELAAEGARLDSASLAPQLVTTGREE